MMVGCVGSNCCVMETGLNEGRVGIETDAYIRALIELHRGLDRQGPGDEVFSREILAALPGLSRDTRIVDLGCGSGAGALVLAAYYGARVVGVDLAEAFLDEMMERARGRGLADRIEPLVCDFAQLPFERGRVDLLWSEGAAYNVTFGSALEKWRPLLAEKGIAVISEITWFTDEAPDKPREYWEAAYPAIAGESENISRAEGAGFDVLFTRRLPAQAWWDHYYNPLLDRISTLLNPDEMMSAVISETLAEIELFREFSDCYGYTFYVLSPVAGKGAGG